MNISTSRKSTQRGLTLIELMIGMTIGLFISAGALTMFASTFSANATAAKIARANDEVSNILRVISRELRRAGYNNGQSPNNFNAITVSGAGGGANNCIVYSWDDGAADNVVDNTERRGFRLNGNVIEWRKSNDAAAPDCNNATGWFAMSGTNLVSITGLTFNKTANPCSTAIAITAEVSSDTTIKFELSDVVVSQNLAVC